MRREKGEEKGGGEGGRGVCNDTFFSLSLLQIDKALIIQFEFRGYSVVPRLRLPNCYMDSTTGVGV